MTLAALMVTSPGMPASGAGTGSLTRYVQGATTSHGAHSALIASEKAAASHGAVLTAVQRRRVTAVRTTATKLVETTGAAIAAERRYSQDLAACDGRPSGKTCYEKEGSKDVLRISVDLQQMIGAGRSWSSAEQAFVAANITLGEAPGRQPTRTAAGASTKRTKMRTYLVQQADAALSAAAVQVVRAKASYRAAVAAVLGKDVPRHVRFERDGKWAHVYATWATLCLHWGVSCAERDLAVLNTKSALDVAERVVYFSKLALAGALGVDVSSPKKPGPSFWGTVVTVAICMATVPLDETGAGEAMDAAAIGSEDAEADAVEGASDAAVAALADEGPGQWQEVTESMSEQAAAYQSQITGAEEGVGYVVKGVKFDGYLDGVLQDAKGLNYAKFIKNGEFYPWYRGAARMLKQADDQLRVAGDTPITWSVAEPLAAKTIARLLDDNGYGAINVVYVPFAE
jgi:hypothetical protein